MRGLYVLYGGILSFSRVIFNPPLHLTLTSDMTFICEDVVYQRLGSIIVSGSASKTSATLSAEVYRLYNGEWTRVGSYSNISGSNGQFSFSHPLGTDGDYGIKIWHDLPGSTVTISGNLTY